MNTRQKLGLLIAAFTTLTGVFLFDYSGVPLAWSLIASTRESKPRNSCARKA
jgi:hypothetical protein